MDVTKRKKKGGGGDRTNSQREVEKPEIISDSGDAYDSRRFRNGL